MRRIGLAVVLVVSLTFVFWPRPADSGYVEGSKS